MAPCWFSVSDIDIFADIFYSLCQKTIIHHIRIFKADSRGLSLSKWWHGWMLCDHVIGDYHFGTWTLKVDGVQDNRYQTLRKGINQSEAGNWVLEAQINV